MSLSILGLISSGAIQISGAEHVAVSYPEFFQVLKSLGAEIKGDQ
jgi:3-phosphoshikimate 1-carboxyvinyltransferase